MEKRPVDYYVDNIMGFIAHHDGTPRAVDHCRKLIREAIEAAVRDAAKGKKGRK